MFELGFQDVLLGSTEILGCIHLIIWSLFKLDKLAQHRNFRAKKFRQREGHFALQYLKDLGKQARAAYFPLFCTISPGFDSRSRQLCAFGF